MRLKLPILYQLKVIYPDFQLMHPINWLKFSYFIEYFSNLVVLIAVCFKSLTKSIISYIQVSLSYQESCHENFNFTCTRATD